MLYKVSFQYMNENNTLRNTMTVVEAKDEATAKQMAIEEASSQYSRFQIGRVTPWRNDKKVK